MIICELGLNHLGDVNYAYQCIDKLIKSKPDAITFQVREKSFYDKNSHSGLVLPKNFYRKIVTKIKNTHIKFGMAIADEGMVDFFEEMGIDFYKVLSFDISNRSLLTRLIKTKKKIFVSTGMSNIHEIRQLVKFLKNNKKRFTLIHTQLTHEINDVNLKAITMLKEQFDMPIAYGHHTTNLNVLFLALSYCPSDLFFYVKGTKTKKHLDDEHAIRLDELDYVINNLKILPNAIGKRVKIKMNNLIEKNS